MVFDKRALPSCCSNSVVSQVAVFCKCQQTIACDLGKPNAGTRVERSLPQDFEKSRNAAVITAQTV
jgi:hypothetical protein